MRLILVLCVYSIALCDGANNAQEASEEAGGGISQTDSLTDSHEVGPDASTVAITTTDVLTTTTTKKSCEINEADPNVEFFLSNKGQYMIMENTQTLISFVNGLCGTQFKLDDTDTISFVEQHGGSTILEAFPVWRYMVSGSNDLTTTTTATTTTDNTCEINDADPNVEFFLSNNGHKKIQENIQTLIGFINGICGTESKPDDPATITFMAQFGGSTILEAFPKWRYMISKPIDLTTTTTTPTTTTIKNSELCARFIEDGVTHENRCVTKDRGAQCKMTSSGPNCTCSVQRTGTYCTVDRAAIGNLGGNSTKDLIDTVNIGKNNPATLIAALPALLSFLTDEQRVEMGVSIEEMVLDATFEEKPLNPRESFTFFNDPSLGNCFTFNHLNMSGKYLARGPGPRYGLRVTLSFNVDEYAPWVEAVGVLTYIHPIGQSIYLESVKHTIKPGNSDQISMKKHTFTRLRSMFSPPCVAKKADSFYFPGDYSVDGCLRSCYQDSVYRSCGCMDAGYARKDGVKTCNFEKLACISEMSDRRGDPYYWPECKCGMPCVEEEYQYETSRAMYRDSTNTSLTSDITIFISTIDVSTQVEEWAFPFSRVLGLTGGFAGVLLGASMVFIIEIILLFVRVGLIGCISRDTMQMRKRMDD